MNKTDYKKSFTFAKSQVVKKALAIISDNDFTPHLEILFLPILTVLSRQIN